jgi:hypothetical protein
MMNEYEDLLAKAVVCLDAALKIEDPVVRAKVLDLVYSAQQVARAAILREIDEALLKPAPSL